MLTSRLVLVRSLLLALGISLAPGCAHARDVVALRPALPGLEFGRVVAA
jgi:hypothetical protein